MNSHLNWDDLKLVRAVAREGSLSGAARVLFVSHATVFRRLKQTETRLGVRLFERSPDGYRPTPAGEEVVALAETVTPQIQALERRLAGRDVRPSGVVRLTTTDSLLVGLLAPLLAEFQQRYPEIDLEVTVSNRPFDLSRREADIAVRPSTSPPEALVGRRLGAIEQAVFTAVDFAGAAGWRAAPAWIGPDEIMHYHQLERWMTQEGVTERCIQRIDSVLGMHAAVAAGAGAAALPLYLAAPDRRLTQVSPALPALQSDLWALTHEDLRAAGRIRVLMAFLGSRTKPALAALSAGRPRTADHDSP